MGVKPHPPAAPPHLSRTAYAVIVGWWTAIGLYYFTQSLIQDRLSGSGTPAWHYLASWMTGVWLWALFTPAVLWLGARFPFRRASWLGPLLLHSAFSLGFAVAHLVLDAAILSSAHVFPLFMKDFVSALVFLGVVGFHQNVLSYFTVLGLQAGFEYYARYQERARQALRLELQAAELQGSLTRARLSALKMQLQPHFLFNTLNAIMVLIRQQRGAEAEVMLGRLSDLLRAVLDDLESQEVTLRRELHYLRLYLSIEEIRFRDRLTVRYEVDPQVLDAAIPQMALQPIVENSIRHGIGRSAAAGLVLVRAQRQDDELLVEIEDDGPGLAAPDSAASDSGIGLANTRERLKQLHGERARLAIEPRVPRGVRVRIAVPWRLMQETQVSEEGSAYAILDPDRG